MNIKKNTITALAGLAVLGASFSASALNYSYTGNLAQDNSVQLFNFTVGASSPNVILETWSYAGGVNAAGDTIARGGFDPILAVFDSAGTLIDQNDDGGGMVAADAITGAQYDTYLPLGSLAAGTYTVSVMQFDNFSLGSTLAAGFRHDAAADAWFQYHFSSGSRDSHWAFDILNVESAQQTNNVPDAGATVTLFGMALSGMALVRSRMRK